MTKRERIEALERKVADLEARVAAAEIRKFVGPYMPVHPTPPQPYGPIWVGDPPYRITTTDGTGTTWVDLGSGGAMTTTVSGQTAESCGIGWRTQ